MKGRWKGLCALWVALALTVYAFPVIAEDFAKQTGAATERPSETGALRASGSEALETKAEDSGEEPTGGTAENAPEEESAAREESAAQETGAAEKTPENNAPAAADDGDLEPNAQLPEERAGETSIAAWLYVGIDEVGLQTIIDPDDNTRKKDITVELNQPLNEQPGLSVTAPSDKRLNGWNLWGCNGSGMVEEGPQEIPVNGRLSGPMQSAHTLFVPIWKDRTITDNSSFFLQQGNAVELPSGTWSVDGDPTLYHGGVTAYAAQSGTLVFHKKE